MPKGETVRPGRAGCPQCGYETGRHQAWHWAELLHQAQAERDALRAAAATAEPLLSLLRYRCAQTIPWGTIGLPETYEVEAAISALRAALGEAGADAR